MKLLLLVAVAALMGSVAEARLRPGCTPGTVAIPMCIPSSFFETCVATPAYESFIALGEALRAKHGPAQTRAVTRDAVSLLGATVNGDFYSPNLTTTVPPPYIVNGVVPVTSNNSLGLYGLVVTANAVTFVYIGTPQFLAFQNNEFVGPVVSVVSGAAPIAGASVSNASANWAGANVTWDATHVYLNMRGLNVVTSDTITVSLSFAVVPTE